VSRNTLIFDFVTLGELFQNNHHEFAMSPNFAVRRFEVDPAYLVMRVFAALGIIKNLSPQRGRYPHVPHAPSLRTELPALLPDAAEVLAEQAPS
jgi:hypothetical protein